jgi:iron(III) transport system substrate-binding protein
MRALTVLLALALPLLAACSDDAADAPADGDADGEVADAEGPLVIYSGRRDVLVGPLVERFEEATGLDVEVRYGTDAELMALLQEEGAAGADQADLFWANTAGALGAAASAGLLAELSDSLRAKPAAFVPSSGRWVPVTTRFRVLAYHPQRVDTTALPASAMDLPQRTDLRGRIGWTPTYSSFQDFVTAMRLVHGEEAAAQWLQGMRALEPKAYESNTPMLEALVAGEIDVALTNHYYVLRMLRGGEEGEVENEEEEEEEEETAGAADAPVAMHHFAAGDVGNLALVTGAGLLRTATHPEAARRFLAFLLSPEAQAFAAAEVNEYPVVPGAALPDYFLPFDRAVALSPSLDFERLSDLEATLQLLRQQGLL